MYMYIYMYILYIIYLDEIQLFLNLGIIYLGVSVNLNQLYTCSSQHTLHCIVHVPISLQYTLYCILTVYMSTGCTRG